MASVAVKTASTANLALRVSPALVSTPTFPIAAFVLFVAVWRTLGPGPLVPLRFNDMMLDVRLPLFRGVPIPLMTASVPTEVATLPAA